jgi:hypothetical protein
MKFIDGKMRMFLRRRPNQYLKLKLITNINTAAQITTTSNKGELNVVLIRGRF